MFCLVLASARKLNAKRTTAKSPITTANTVNPISMLSSLHTSNTKVRIWCRKIGDQRCPMNHWLRNDTAVTHPTKTMNIWNHVHSFDNIFSLQIFVSLWSNDQIYEQIVANMICINTTLLTGGMGGWVIYGTLYLTMLYLLCILTVLSLV